ncbi:MAG TPA: translocation/assembly module TamB [Longimicrobiales bacterium]|nr:translocation/assembly module TamB [Longimicrobiales bacterium]
MKRAGKTLVWIIAGIAAGLAIAAFVLLFITRTDFGMERARGYALDFLADRVDGTVKIGRVTGRGLLGGVTVHGFSIVDKRGRQFMNADSLVLSYNWRTFLRGEVIIDHSIAYGTHLSFEQLPGDSIWNFQRVFPDRDKPGAKKQRRLILLNDLRFLNASAIVRRPLQQPATERDVLEDVPGGTVAVMRFDSLYGTLSRVIWESPTEEGKLIDIRSLTGRGFVWREPMHVTDARGTVTLRDTIVSFDIPDFRMRSSNGSMVGRVIMEKGRNYYDIRVDSRSFTFTDVQWLYPRMPNSGGGSGTIRIQSQRPKGVLWLATNARLVAPGTRVAGSFGVVTGADSLYFTNVDLRASPLNLQLIQSMLPNKLPINGLLVGTVELKGGLSSLDTRGNMQLSNAQGTSSAKWRGNVDVRNGIGARNFSADVEKFDLGLLNAVKPELKLRGQLTGHVEASGNTNRSVTFAADIQHYLAGYTSSFTGKGTYSGGTGPSIDVELNALPLSLQEVAQSYPALTRLRGDARGPIRLTGPLDNLTVRADLQTAGGRAQIDGRLTRTSGQPRYIGDATLYTFQLDRLIGDMSATQLDGTVSFDVGGTNVQNTNGSISARLASGEFKHVGLSDIYTRVRLRDGIAVIDTAVATTSAGKIDAHGAIGLTADRSGRTSFTIASDSIGKLRAAGSIEGSIEGFNLAANVDVEKLVYGSMTSDRVIVAVTGQGLGTDYATFSLRDLQVGKDNDTWKLTREAHFTLDDHGLRIDTIDITRRSGGHASAWGRIAWHDATHTPEPGQSSDFRLDFSGVPFSELVVLTTGVENVKGIVNGNVRLSGNAVSPVLDADATVTAIALGEAALDRMTGSFTYANERINARVDADKNGKRVLLADGVIPFNLAFLPVKNRRLNQPLRFTFQADSLPAAFLTAPLIGFTDVRGRLDGTMIATGPTTKPQFAGSIALKDGGGAWDVTGVRYRDVEGTMWLENNRVGRIDANARTVGGSAHATGTIDFARPANPAFNLTANAQNFLAAKRRDADFTASGNVQLRGHYRQPLVTGGIDIQQGSLYLDEIYRRYQIVELDNPLLYDVVDTSLVALRTILPRTTNPFIKNLVIDSLRIGVGREGWLRSRDLNVEVSGDLTVAFLLQDTLFNGPRTAQDLVLNGSLRALRGTYQLYYPGISRQFSIRDGTIEFPGTPGVDPNLGFNAVYRAAQRRGDPIDIVAVVGGTLRTPNVHLTSDENPPVSESDLASYLFFGVPTYELSATQSAGLSQTTTQFAKTSGYGYLASGLQSFAQSYGLLDYVALTASEGGVGIQQQGALASLFAGTRLELGRYVNIGDENVYLAYTQPLSGASMLPGVRIEWRLMPSLTAEVFSEDRFARSYNFANTSDRKRVYGIFLYREWGY